MHVLIDGSEGDRTRLNDSRLLLDLLRDLPLRMDMQPISTPSIRFWQSSPEHPQDWGLSGFVMIAESHLSLHTFPERGIAWIDLFSCKAFDAAPLIEMLAEALGLGVVRIMRVNRGLDEEYNVPIWAEQKMAVAP